MKRGFMRTTAVGALALGLAVLAVPSVASPPPDGEWEVTAIDCTGTFGARELVVAGYFGADNTSGGGDAEFHDGATLVWGNVEESSTYDGTDFVLDVTFKYGQQEDGGEGAQAAEPGTSAGTMTITGTASPSGEPVVESMRYKDGNAMVWWTDERQLLVGAGAITSATGDVAFTQGSPLDCGGQILKSSWSLTEPATQVYHSSYASAYCELPGEPQSFLALGFEGQYRYATVGIGVDFESETAQWYADGPTQWRGGAITGDLEVYMPREYAGQTATLDLQVGQASDRGMIIDKLRQSSFHQRYATWPLNGTVALPDGTEVEVENCDLTAFWTFDRVSSKAGQKPGGKPPVNDLPSGALLLADGQTVTVSTRGAAIATEAPCVLDTEEGPQEVDFGRTVWYSVEGTGGEVFLSTLGSTQYLDTVLGVYQADSLTQVACADEGTDPTSWWAAEVSVPTTAGTTYLVQIGGHAYSEEGIGPDWGELVLSRR